MKHTLLTLAFPLLAPLAALQAAPVAVAPSKPNIVLFLIDDMPWYGTDVRMDPDLPASAMAFRNMPNVQKLAQQGMTFRQAYSGAGMCAPSRCCIQTGMTAAHHLYSGNGGFGQNKTYKFVEEDLGHGRLAPGIAFSATHEEVEAVLAAECEEYFKRTEGK